MRLAARPSDGDWREPSPDGDEEISDAGDEEEAMFPQNDDPEENNTLGLKPVDDEHHEHDPEGLISAVGKRRKGQALKALRVDVAETTATSSTPFALPTSSLDNFQPTPFGASTPPFTALYKNAPGTAPGTRGRARHGGMFSPGPATRQRTSPSTGNKHTLSPGNPSPPAKKPNVANDRRPPRPKK